MPIDFTDFLRSLRSDGKLFVSTVIKAAAGKKILTDARDGANSLEIDLENDAGEIETVVIPKGAAVDATARAAAAEVEQELEDHEATPHGGGGGGDGTDQVARDAAEAAQAEIDAHEGPTPRTTPISCSPESWHHAARNEAQAAQDDIDAHEVGPSYAAGPEPRPQRRRRPRWASSRSTRRGTPTPPRRTPSTGRRNPPTLRGSPTPTTSGSFRGEPNPLAQTLGTYYFLIVDHKLQVTANNSFGQLRWEDAPWSDLLVVNAGYRGARANDAAALSHIQMNGDVFFDRHSNHIRVASNFVAGVTEHTGYESKRLARIEEVPELDPLFVERSTLPPSPTIRRTWCISPTGIQWAAGQTR